MLPRGSHGRVRLGEGDVRISGHLSRDPTGVGQGHRRGEIHAPHIQAQAQSQTQSGAKRPRHPRAPRGAPSAVRGETPGRYWTMRARTFRSVFVTPTTKSWEPAPIVVASKAPVFNANADCCTGMRQAVTTARATPTAHTARPYRRHGSVVERCSVGHLSIRTCTTGASASGAIGCADVPDYHHAT